MHIAITITKADNSGHQVTFSLRANKEALILCRMYIIRGMVTHGVQHTTDKALVYRSE